METETISNYEKEKSTEQLGLDKHDDLKISANHVDTSKNHMNNGHEIESAQDKDDLDDSRSDEEEEDVPLIVQGSKSDEERSDDELSHLDLHNDEDDDDGEELVESASQKQEDDNKLKSNEEHQEVSSSGADEPILANEAGSENIVCELTNGDKEISDEKLLQSDDTEINKTDAGKNETRQELQDGIKDNATHKEEPRDLEQMTADKNKLDNDNHKANQINDIQNVKDPVSNNKHNLLETTELDQSTTNKNDLAGQESDGNQNKTEAQENSKSSEVVEDECDDKEVNDKDKEVDKDKECDTGKEGDIAKALLEGDKDKECDTGNEEGIAKDKEGDEGKEEDIAKDKEGDEGKEEDIAKDKEGDEGKECDTGKEEAVATNNDVDAAGNSNKVEQAVDKSSDGGALVEEAKESDKGVDKNKGDGEQDSLLKQTLSRPAEYKEPDVEEDIEMDDDFDPSLLCPDIAMEVDEAPVITNSTEVPLTDGTGSSALYEQTFSTAVDEFTGAEASILLTPEEENLRIETFANSPVQYTKIHCTACNVHLGSALDGQGNRFVHPLLKVLICKNCYHFYTSGEFEKDEDGSELYCRWCGQGGQVMCCSNCEMVFCKKCIRINFDRKTIAQIRDSEEWICFRCNPSQITYLKIHCAEFMEYVRRETSRASTLDNAVEFMKLDHTRCCSTQKKKSTEQGSEVPKKRKRKTSVDPDFDPHRECDSPQPSTSGTQVQKNDTITVTPNPTDPNKNGGVVKVSTPSFVKVTPSTSNTTPYRPRFYGPRSRVQVTSTNSGQPPRPTNSTSPGYIKIVPRAPTTTTTSTRHRAPTYIRPANNKPGTPMKHEWFERTVIAAARVNSNLSYTLTQLNRAQANATSVELLAVVHNKLQEILSSSINSLISIRKKLRLEFIEGIKNTRFPAANKPQTVVSKQTTNNSNDDDDVIFVDHSASSTSTSASTSSTTNNITSNVIANMSTPPPLAPIKKTTGTLNTNERSNSPATNVKVVGNDGQPKSFLRVKSLNALLNVSSECITIPDDSPATILTPVGSTTSTAIDDDDDDVKIIEKPIEHVDLTDSEHEEKPKEETKEATFDLTSSPSNNISPMKKVYVKIKRSLKMEELIKQEYGNSSIEGNSNADGNRNVAEKSNVSDNSNVDGKSKADENINDVTE